jgi:hypothetical protein
VSLPEILHFDDAVSQESPHVGGGLRVVQLLRRTDQVAQEELRRALRVCRRHEASPGGQAERLVAPDFVKTFASGGSAA